MRYQIFGDWFADARTFYQMTDEELREKRLWAEKQEAKRREKILARRIDKR